MKMYLTTRRITVATLKRHGVSAEATDDFASISPYTAEVEKGDVFVYVPDTPIPSYVTALMGAGLIEPFIPAK